MAQLLLVGSARDERGAENADRDPEEVERDVETPRLVGERSLVRAGEALTPVLHRKGEPRIPGIVEPGLYAPEVRDPLRRRITVVGRSFEAGDVPGEPPRAAKRYSCRSVLSIGASLMVVPRRSPGPQKPTAWASRSQ